MYQTRLGRSNKTSRRNVATDLLASAFSLFILLLMISSIATAQAKTSMPPTRHIIICVDGVGFSTIEKMRAEGHFKMFKAPSRMISPFPTLTNLAMTEILAPAGAGIPEGYEDSFYDTEKNRLRGGIVDRLRGDRFLRGTFRELFDYHPSAIKSGLGYAVPPVSTYFESLSDIIRLGQKARASVGDVFLAYTGATDSLAHLGGEKLVRSFLARLEATIDSIARNSNPSVAVTIFSDHGNHYRKYKRVGLKAALRGAGFRLEGSIRDEKSVVLPQFGLIGCAALFTKESNESRVAEALGDVGGVDFAAYETNGVVHVISQNGRATIERRNEDHFKENHFKYVAEAGDPLGLSDVMRRLAAEGKIGREGYIADADLFEATRDGERPDAVRRVFEGVTKGAHNRANVIVNFHDGYYSGSSTLDVFAVLQAAHGNLGREQSFGFVMSTDSEMPPSLRAGDVWRAIGSPRLNKKSVRQK